MELWKGKSMARLNPDRIHWGCCSSASFFLVFPRCIEIDVDCSPPAKQHISLYGGNQFQYDLIPCVR